MEYCIRFIDLPLTVNALVVQDSENFYNIYVNAGLSHEKQQQAILHELRHIQRDDFYSDKEIEDIEAM